MSEQNPNPTDGSHYDFHGDVNAGNLNTGTQNIGRDQNIITQTPKAERQCPKPPSKPKEFGGRDEEFNQLKGKLKAGETTAITTAVQGLGGIGKTTLAQMLAHQLHEDKTFRAVLWANVTRNPNAANIIRDWVTHYADSAFAGATFHDVATLATTAKQYLEDVINEKCEECEPPRVLIVLDDVWDNGLETARQLKAACPFAGQYATILITTRYESVADGLQAEIAALEHLNPEAAANLLHEYLNLPRESLKPLGEALRGHPLALELAARRVKKESRRAGATLESALQNCITAYEQGITAGSSFKDLKLAQGEKPEDNLEIALELSYSELDPADQKRFRALGILAYDEAFDLSILAAIWELPLYEPEKVEDHCDSLRNLAFISPTDMAGWYRQHPLLRAYACALLNQTDEAAPTFDRYATQLTELAKQFNTLPPEEWAQLEPYFPHLHAMGDELAARWEREAQTPELAAQVMAYMDNIRRYIWLRPEVIMARTESERFKWLEIGLAACEILEDQTKQSQFLTTLGYMWSALGEKRKALDYYEQALPLDRAVGDRGGEATTLNNIGLAWSALGEKRKALDYYEQALPLRRAVGDRGGEATTLNNIGGAWSALGEKRKALDYYAQALPLRRAVGDRGGEATTLNNIGGAWSALGEKRKALDYYEQALPLLRAVGDRRGEAATLNNIGMIYREWGDLDKAIEYVERCVMLDEQVEHPDLESDRRMLAQLRAQRDGTAAPNDEQAMLQQLIVLYQQLGEEKFKALLQEQNISDEQLALFIALISQSNTEE